MLSNETLEKAFQAAFIKWCMSENRLSI